MLTNFNEYFQTIKIKQVYECTRVISKLLHTKTTATICDTKERSVHQICDSLLNHATLYTPFHQPIKSQAPKFQ